MGCVAPISPYGTFLPMTHRTINAAGLALVKASEGYRTQAYQDGGGVWTIGYGHTHGVKQGDSCDMPQALEWLADDLEWAEQAVSDLVTVPLTDNQFAALVDFCFNIGRPKFASCTMLKKLNEGGYGLVPPYLKSWIFDNGKQMPGLVTRRAAEAELWSTK